MNVECVCFGPVRDAVGEKRFDVALADGATVDDLLDAVVERGGDVTFRDADGLLGDRTVTVNKRDVRHEDGLDTVLTDGDVVRLTGAVYGG